MEVILSIFFRIAVCLGPYTRGVHAMLMKQLVNEILEKQQKIDDKK